jgi:alkylation response protein AidB-like acyl-CoA dehydrogenase
MSVPVTELRASTGHSFSMYSSFCAPAASMLAALAPDWVKTLVVPRLSDGDWTATMCMTEPQAGTDLRQIAARAVAQPDGSWRLSGSKIFISGGDHDLTDNIIHIVLAKVPLEDGRLPPGLGGVNVFLVSKRQIDTTSGALGPANGVCVSSIEHKMGIEGSATCALDFDNAVAWRIGGPATAGASANMAPMFFLMNYARVGTAMSGVGYAEIACQNAAAYARERLSGRAGTSPAYASLVADPIIAHADVRRLLLESRSFADGARAGAMRAAVWQSVAQHGADAAQRQRAGDLLEVLTPVMKAFFTDRGFAAAVSCQQVLGGHGYVKDYGLEQFVRNARIGQLYEGANGIQATDLVQRKLTAHGGRARRQLEEAITEFIEQHADKPAMAPFVQPLRKGLDQLSAALQCVDRQRTLAPASVSAGAYDLLTALGILYVGWTWAEIAAVVSSPGPCAHLDDAGRNRKLELAKVWMQREMPLIDSLRARIESGNDALLDLTDDQV